MGNNIKYCLGAFDKPLIRDDIQISESEYNYFSDILERFLKLSADENLFRVVSLNFEDLKQKIDAYITKNYQLDFYEFDYLFVDINRLILNFLSSVRTYLDHTETRLKREYGSSSEEYLLFQTETAKAYDEYFEYRFLYKLRNFSQHCGLPAGSAAINAFQDENLIHRDSMNVFFKRDTLLSKFDKWGKVVEIDLKGMPDQFDVLPLVKRYLQTFTRYRSLNKIPNKKTLQKRC